MNYEPFDEQKVRDYESMYLEEDLYAFLKETLTNYFNRYGYQRIAEIWYEAKNICRYLGKAKHPKAVLLSHFEELLVKYEYYNELHCYGLVMPHNEYAARQVLVCCYYMIWTSTSMDELKKGELYKVILNNLDTWKALFLQEFDENKQKVKDENLSFSGYDYLVDDNCPPTYSELERKVEELESEIHAKDEEIKKMKLGYKKEEDGFTSYNSTKRFVILYKLLKLPNPLSGNEREEFKKLAIFMTHIGESTFDNRISPNEFKKQETDWEQLVAEYPILKRKI